MATRTRSSARPARTLLFFLLVLAAIFGSVAAGTRWSTASWAPNLALDLEGGTQIILTPRSDDGAEITPDEVNQAIEIIRQRVDSSGVAEAEITSQAGRNIVVALPGRPSEATLDLVRQSAQMRFRAFLAESGPGTIDPASVVPPTDAEAPADGSTVAPEESVTEAPTDGATDTSSDGQVAGVTGEATQPAEDATEAATDPATEDATEAATDPATEAPAEEPVDTAADPVPATPEEIEAAAILAADSNQDGIISAEPLTPPTSASDQAWITEQVLVDFYTLDCTDPANRVGGGGDDPEGPLVACSREGEAKYILGPMELAGTEIATAGSGLQVTDQGIVTNTYAVQLEFTAEGGEIFEEVTTRLSSPEAVAAGTNRFAMVLDGLVISAPSVTSPIPNGQAEISGNQANPFTRVEAADLANKLSFGALPITFEVQSEEQISATLGTEQLERGLLAGLIGLALVVVYSLFQYRGLALVTVASLTAAGVMVYGVIALLSWLQGYRLSLPGVAGLIVAIGITADSFIVYFERIRDEVREGRRLEDAVEQGWIRARRTILASDAVNLLAAAVLYFLAVGGVRGFAFTLGLTTLIDLVVVFLFTHPMVKLLVRTRFFGQGHRLSGLDPEHLGATVSAYRGRGQFRKPEERLTIAERRRAAAVAPTYDGVPPDPADAVEAVSATSTKDGER